jgi:hypothetical protein
MTDKYVKCTKDMIISVNLPGHPIVYYYVSYLSGPLGITQMSVWPVHLCKFTRSSHCSLLCFLPERSIRYYSNACMASPSL